MAASTDELVEIILDIDWDKEPQCVSRVHATASEFHDGPATYWFRGPHQSSGLVCSRWVNAIHALGARCQACTSIHYVDEFTFTEL